MRSGQGFRLSHVRLEHNRASCPLFDTGRLVRNLERAYLHAWRLHESGAPPESFGVSEPDGSLASGP